MHVHKISFTVNWIWDKDINVCDLKQQSKQNTQVKIFPPENFSGMGKSYKQIWTVMDLEYVKSCVNDELVLLLLL